VIKLREFFGTVGQWTVLIAYVTVWVAMFLMLLKSLEPLSPLITFLIALGFTLHAFRRTWLGIISLCGIAIYILSWPVTGRCGLAFGLSVWTAGFSLWLWAVCRSFRYSPRTI
jgi:hypothetical protein